MVAEGKLQMRSSNNVYELCGSTSPQGIHNLLQSNTGVDLEREALAESRETPSPRSAHPATLVPFKTAALKNNSGRVFLSNSGREQSTLP